MVSTLRGFHLPPGAAGDYRLVRASVAESLEVEYPAPTPELVGRVCATLRKGAAEVRALPSGDRVAALGVAGERFLDPHDPIRTAALELLPLSAGLSPRMAEAVLDGMARDWTPHRIRQLLEAEFPDARVLDGFREGAPDTRSRALPPGLVLQVGAGNVAGVSVGGAIRALLLGSGVLLKPGLHDVLLPTLFARALRESAPRLAAALAVVYWPGGSAAAEQEALRQADAVVVYGGSDTVAALRGRLPATTPLVAYPHRISVAAVGRGSSSEGSAADVARSAARAVAMFDQRGCVSPHVIWVEEGGAVAPRRWAELLARALDELEGELPAGPAPAQTATSIQQLRGTWRMKEAAGEAARVFASADVAWTVVFDPDPAFAPSCLGRFVWVKPVGDLFELVEHVGPVAALLQTVGVAGAGDRAGALAEALGEAGASRVTSLDRMAWPPPWWHHDGTGPLRSLVRWVDWEVGS